jgi:transitional endoplasmic reticulum ATPase
MMLRAIKNEMKGATLLELDGADIAEQGMERMNATIKEAFDRARENSPAIILLDEVEELLLKRSDATEYSAQVTSEMLRQIDGISKLEDVIVVGATNRPDAIDPAALRPGRFDKLVFIKPPNKTQRADMFKSNLTEIPLSDDVSFNSLADATPGYTGADIYHVCREAKTAALEKAIKSGDEEKITADMLKEIIDKTRASAPEQVVAQYLAFYAKYGER